MCQGDKLGLFLADLARLCGKYQVEITDGKLTAPNASYVQLEARRCEAFCRKQNGTGKSTLHVADFDAVDTTPPSLPELEIDEWAMYDSISYTTTDVEPEEMETWPDPITDELQDLVSSRRRGNLN